MFRSLHGKIAARVNTVAPTSPSRRGSSPHVGARREFRPDIEGLRAVAVLAVVLFHAGVPGVGGGFVGVDIFFVISGFLITGLLLRDVTTHGRGRLTRFYGARARRLLPASASVLVVTAVMSTVLLAPLQARSVLGDVIACALYVGNYRFAVHGTDYLAADTPPSLVQHYWSLGVEEQFYLLWPALILGTAWVVHRITRRASAPAKRLPYLVVLAVVAGASFALSLEWTHTLPSWAFFSLPTRAWELAAGGLVALTASRWRRPPARCAAAPAVARSVTATAPVSESALERLTKADRAGQGDASSPRREGFGVLKHVGPRATQASAAYPQAGDGSFC